MILIRRSFSVRHVVIGIAISFAVLFWAADAAAQASRVGATVEGIVRDTSGAVIPNSKVTVHNPLTNQSRTVTTDEQVFFGQSSFLSAPMKCEWNKQTSHLTDKQALERVSDKLFISTSCSLRRPSWKK
jgi:hypothetical protein